MDDRLDAALRDLGSRIAFPPTPDLRAAVADRLSAPPFGWWRPAPWPRALALALLVTLLVVATAAALVIALPGLRVTFLPTLPTPSVGALATRLALGERITPDVLGELDVRLPAGLGDPDEAYVLRDGDVVSLIYHVGEGLPQLADGTGIGLLVQEIDGVLDRPRVEKLIGEVGATVTAVDVAGDDGFWVEGRPHVIHFFDASGADWSETTRLAGDTLVWERNGVLYRIESGLGLDATLAIAESMGP